MSSNGQTQGFGHSNKRIATEIIVGLSVLAAVVIGGYALVSAIGSAMVDELPYSVDTQIGELAYGQLADEDKRCTNPALKAYVESIAAPIVDVAQAPFPFQFVVLDDASINAFALPGGFVAVNRGLLEKAESGEEVAGVLAHELQHAIQRHGLKRIARELGVAATISVVLGTLDLEAMTSMAVGLVGRSYDREQELEADQKGRTLLLEAGIHPSGMAIFFQRLAKEGPSVPELLSTHPDSGERARLAAQGPKFEGRPRKLPRPGQWPCHLDKAE